MSGIPLLEDEKADRTDNNTRGDVAIGGYRKAQRDRRRVRFQEDAQPSFLRQPALDNPTPFTIALRRVLIIFAVFGLLGTNIYRLRTRIEAERRDVKDVVDWDIDILPWVFSAGPSCSSSYSESSDVQWDTDKKKKRPHKGKKHLNGKKAEEIFLSIPNAQSAENTSRHYAASPHTAGSLEDLRTTVDLLHLFQTELGIDQPEDEPIFNAGSSESRQATFSITRQSSPSKPRAWVDTYYPLLSTPGDRSVELLSNDGDAVWTANLTEDGDHILDPISGKYATELPAFHAYSHDGAVEGKLVFANYGREEDFRVLDRLGVNLTGAIVVARSGYNHRGLKIKQAEDRGAAGCLLYNDPRDDGTVHGDNGYAAYPFGPARNPTSYERGSVQYVSIYPGDPTTPGHPSYMKSKRSEPENIPKIPSLPISWSNAQILLKEIEKGGENRTVRLVNRVTKKVSPIWNVMAVIPGYIRDEVVVVGNHRDSLALGTTGPVSGTVSLVEVVRGLGALRKKGWQPIRTIIVASWDGGEHGLVGSTEWGEDFAHWIKKHVVAYLNVASSAGGSRFTVASSMSLGQALIEVAKDIPHPTDVNRTLWDARYDVGPYAGRIGEGEDEGREEHYRGVGNLGSGDDYAVFLHHLGIASSSGSFQQSMTDAPRPYNSVFDTHKWQERYGDKGYHRHIAISRFTGLQLLRLVDATVLPFNTTHYAYELGYSLDFVQQLAIKMQVDVDLSKLRRSVNKLRRSSRSLDQEKVNAEQELHKLMVEWAKLKQREGWLSKKWRKLIDWFRGRFNWHRDEEENRLVVEGLPRFCACGLMRPRIGRPPAWAQEHQTEAEESKYQVREDDVDNAKHKNKKHKHKKRQWGQRRKLLKRLRKAAERVRRANAKLISFEQGLTSGGGLKGREWYKHLGVAPGELQGYHATPFPGLTEAITMDKNATAASHEAERLANLLDKLAKKLER